MSRLSEAIPRKLDVRLIGIALVLTLVGIAMVHSTTSGTARGDLGGRQAVYALVALGVAAVFLAIDYRLLLEYSPGLYGVTLAVLAGLLLFGSRVAGARSWIRLWGFQVQPSELARISIALLLAFLLERDDRKLLRTRTIAIIAAAVGLPMLLVLLQPDTGVALTYLPFLLAALFFGGMRAKWWALLILTGALAIGGSWFLLKDYQKDRIRTFLDPHLSVRGAGYQVRQARIAVGSGGIFGKGWKQGTQSRLGFLPVRHTDFVFAALAEEWGFAGVGVVVGLYGLFLAHAFRLARDARDRGGAMLVLLIATNIAGEAVWNIAMNVGLLPTTGITLPLISYGGSSLVATWAMIGLMLSVAYRRFVNV